MSVTTEDTEWHGGLRWTADPADGVEYWNTGILEYIREIRSQSGARDDIEIA
jgi:hypothetical protein